MRSPRCTILNEPMLWTPKKASIEKSKKNVVKEMLVDRNCPPLPELVGGSLIGVWTCVVSTTPALLASFEEYPKFAAVLSLVVCWNPRSCRYCFSNCKSSTLSSNRSSPFLDLLSRRAECVCVFTRLRFVRATYWDLSPCLLYLSLAGSGLLSFLLVATWY
jgi:hypothetical protein